jgi:hypothetical protein
VTDRESPDAAGTGHRAIEIDELDGRVVSESKRHQDFDQAPIRATLIGSDRCAVDGIVARGHAPVLGLCRKLLAAGYDPRRPLHVYRDDTVALKIQSIGEGAAFTVEDNRRGTPSFRRWRNPGERSGAALPSACDSNRPLSKKTNQRACAMTAFMIRSIRKDARFTVEDDRRGRKRQPGCGAASPVAQIAEEQQLAVSALTNGD